MYQPPWQYPEVLKRISNECYDWLTDWLSKNDFKVTLNINYSLVELLRKNNLEKIIENIGRGVENGNIELTGTSAYHAILPLIPESEARRQIKLNHEKNKQVFGDSYKPRGFFPPEMAFSSETAEIIKDLGCKWTITEDIVHDINKSIPDNFISTIQDFPVFFRSSYWSNKFAIENPGKGDTNAENFIREVEKEMKDDSYTILAFDIETIGHHHKEHPYNPDTMNYLEKTIKDSGMSCVFVSELLEKFPERKNLGEGSYRGSWSTNREHILNGNYFPLWRNPNNKIHEIQWQLIYHAMNIVEKSRGDKNHEIARDLLDRGLNSCQFWWAAPENMSRKDFKPEYILDASKPVYDSIMSLSNIYELDKTKAEQRYQELKQ